MSAQTHAGETLFEHAPPMGAQRRLGLVKPRQLRIGRRALLIVLVGWIPIVLLTFAQVALFGGEGITSLWREVGIHARYLVAAPLLIVAEAQCATCLGATVRYFADTGLVPDERRKEFEAAVASTRRLLDSTVAEFVVFALAYLVTALAALQYAYDQLPVWHRSAGLAPGYSAAGWWHVLISMPLLLVLILGWGWRLALWARLLWIISRLDLRLVALHPDRVAGLGFVSRSLNAFSIVALALAAIAAGRSAHFVLLYGAMPTPNLFFNIGFLVALLAMFVAPLLIFSPGLLRTWQHATREYGALAARASKAFESQWLDRNRRTNRNALENADFSATADLYSIVSNVNAIRLVAVDLKDLIALVVALLSPFALVMCLAVPTDTILQTLKTLLF